MTTRVFSSGIRRREDPRLITGRAAYTDDIKLPGMAHAAILRSPYAHASISSIDTSAAASQPGVIAVFTGEDTEGALNGLPCAWLIPGSDLKTPAHPAIAKDKVRYVGDAVAVVVAESRYEAEDALEHIAVEYEPMGAVISPRRPPRTARRSFMTTFRTTSPSRGRSPAETRTRRSSRRT